MQINFLFLNFYKYYLHDYLQYSYNINFRDIPYNLQIYYHNFEAAKKKRDKIYSKTKKSFFVKLTNEKLLYKLFQKFKSLVSAFTFNDS